MTGKKKNNGNLKISVSRRILFSIILLMVPIVLLLLIEISLRSVNYGKALKLFLKSENYPGYYEINRDVNYRYFSTLGETSPTGDIFLIEKPDTCYRIFVFGGSTTRGFPYQESTAFPRILYYRLQDVFPDRQIEVINLSASAINSYTYIDMVDEVLDQKPDLILVYGGHNEYYGALGVGSVEMGGNFRWMKKLNLKLTRLRTYQFLKNSIGKIGQQLVTEHTAGGETLMSRIVKDKSIVFGSKLYQKGVDQFESNMTELVKKIQRKNVSLVISEVVSNVYDLPPFESMKTDEYPAAIEVYQQAKQLESEGNFVEARNFYYKAKDLDIIRFRAPEAINDVIHQIGEKYHVSVVPMKSYFEDASPQGIIGNELILEHLHPNINGYFLMADAFFKTLNEQHLISSQWDEQKILPSAYYQQNWGFTELDSLIGDLNIKSLKSGWPFKPEREVNNFLRSYRPVSHVDSMAFNYLNSQVRHIEDEHIKLAGYYAGMGQNDKAFEEYRALIMLHPYIGDLYYDASKYLIAQRKYIQAFELINSAPLMLHDYFYFYMQGTLKLRIGQEEDGINDLNHALTIRTEKDNPLKVLVPLYSAYREKGDSTNKEKILKEIRLYEPNFLEPVAKTPANEELLKISMKEIYNRALALIEKNERQKALDLLLKTDKVKANASIKKLIGMIYFMEKNYPEAYKYSGESFRINPGDYDNLNNYFILTLMKKDMKSAAEILQQLPSLKIAPDKIERFENLYRKRENEIKAETKK